MAYLESIYSADGRNLGFFDTDGHAVWAVLPDDIPAALQPLVTARFLSLGEARDAFRAALAPSHEQALTESIATALAARSTAIEPTPDLELAADPQPAAPAAPTNATKNKRTRR